MGIQGKLWRVIRSIYNVNQSCVYLLPSLQLNGLLFADDFVGLGDSKQGLQDMINVVHAYSKKLAL